MSSAGRIETRLDQRPGGLVAFVTVDDASRLNSMSSALMDELVERLSELATSANLRALVLTGAGDKAFIGGADIREMSALSNAEEARRFITRLHKCCDAIRAIPVPTIARINGFTLGGGLEIAVSCDVRVAAESAVFGMPEVKLGIPSVIEAALLPTLVGWGRARQIVLFGENFSAQEALSWGLIERMVGAAELDEAVDQWIDQVLSCPPGAVRLQKQLIRQWEDMPVRPAIEAGIDSFTAAVRSGEPATAMRAFLERQRARKATL
jgi:enoyl-CoA hydratase/carnithine racemase